MLRWTGSLHTSSTVFCMGMEIVSTVSSLSAWLLVKFDRSDVCMKIWKSIFSKRMRRNQNDSLIYQSNLLMSGLGFRPTIEYLENKIDNV
mmetsp:Transcript_440/g.411  ORF Transcript_440/g.411 Transcript_440/m.411 type:complete len:90 (+) Transcript_440:646-915(+)